MQVDYDTYGEKDFTSQFCGWQGKGSESSHGDISEYSSFGELDCPECSHLVAYWQAPMEKKEEKK